MADYQCSRCGAIASMIRLCSSEHRCMREKLFFGTSKVDLLGDLTRQAEALGFYDFTTPKEKTLEEARHSFRKWMDGRK